MSKFSTQEKVRIVLAEMRYPGGDYWTLPAGKHFREYLLSLAKDITGKVV